MGVEQGVARRELTSELRGALMRDIGNPVIGLAAWQLEAFAGTRNGEADGGVRARLSFPFTRLAVAADHNVVANRTRVMVSLSHPMRRGGLFSDGTVVRLDAAAGPTPSATLGIEKPIQRRIPAGVTRPRRDFARLYATASDPVPLPDRPGAREALADARDAASFIGRMVVPWLDHPAGDRGRSERAVLRQLEVMRRELGAGAAGPPRTVDLEARRLHDAVDRAFAAVLANPNPALALRVAQQARAVLLDEVLLPYNRLIGQRKREDSTRGLALGARGIFLRWLHVESGVPAAAIEPALAAFVALLDIVEENRAGISAAWADSRFTWLPLQFALRPEDHDTQGELDALIERATGGQFTDGNQVSYIINEQFPFHLSRTIREAEDYHVLWIHDVRGVDDGGDPDEQSFAQVLRSYLRALTARARSYDSTGRMPVYLILLDEWFYQVRKTRPWMDILEDPLGRRAHFPRAFAAWEDSLRAAQDSLRAAVAGSRLLQAQRAQFGDAWLHDLVRVHVNITNAADHTFWSRRIANGVPVPDNMMRDHRKLVFYDITEDDPWRGEAIFTGAGVGEHYASLSWEDRALLVRGPAALQLKTAARELLVSQGTPAPGIPWHLRPRSLPPDYDARVRAAATGPGRTLRAAAFHNEAGYGDKDVNVAKAVLYTLMPARSVVKVPDSLWNSAFWASALAGCALRGGRVLVIAPALANAPAPAFGSMEESYRMLWRLLAFSERLGQELTARGGLLRVGIYASNLRVNDIPGKLHAVRATFAAEPWLRDLFGFPPTVYDSLPNLEAKIRGLSMSAAPMPEYEADSIPKLHLKVNAFASPDAWQLLARHEWVDMTWDFVLQRIAQVQARREALRSFDEYPDALLDIGDQVVRDWFARLSPDARSRVVFYSVFGSQNQNTRSMVMDAEDAFVVSGWPSVIPYIDLISLIGQSRWLTDPSQLATYLPPHGWLVSRIAHWFRLAF
jgi:hypothetical protein